MKHDLNEKEITYQLKKHEDKLLEGVEEDPVISVVDSILYKAIESRASDIHLEPTKSDLRVRYRIDGILYDQPAVSFAQRFLVLSRLKVLSGLDIAESRRPQDGKLMVSIAKSSINQNPNFIDLRISTFPSIYGEKVVIRVLDKSNQVVTIQQLGFNKNILDGINNLLGKLNGFFLVTGPTGCGKTTTLYAMLSGLDKRKLNIVTMEDPVEYDIDGICQSQVNSKIDFDFANGMRTILRQDPDVIMIGEIRDKPTASMAIEAALTGHLVLSTLHTSSASGAIVRLIEMGVEPFLINASVSGIIAQTLVRKLCDKCKVEVELDEKERQYLENKNIKLKKVFKAKGCRDCLNTGYFGRIACAELLLITDEIRNLILQQSHASEIEKIATKAGMILMKNDLLSKLESGLISLEEFLNNIN
ncbi:TPA: type II secretion system protein GspE [Candidatus Dependentiae bacterium]|nr:MAG: Type II secretion system protein E (GspE) [candidate division TM6 bacterium GW2011_GWE2_31_21]KKP52992.1 MAG: Type II secretion system protein E (GspE) [candidate division TM6 bacterium GW2011_GWF2_33_332]HBS47770.1 type II secretion system protein GspE [Candidatus Dependentiae bacterium]HBZ73254.1 type II secretion system protein GspE [Candidatus Dependentiae bacterium]